MSLTKLAAGALSAIVLGGVAVHAGCSEPEPECERDTQCNAATTACAKGVCRGGKCEAQPVADGTRVVDQAPVATKLCVKLECKAGRATEVADNTKTAADVPCQKQTCEAMTPKSENVMDGVPCMSSNGTCKGGTCIVNDSGPFPTDTGGGDTSTGDTSTDDTGGDSSDGGGD